MGSPVGMAGLHTGSRSGRSFRFGGDFRLGWGTGIGRQGHPAARVAEAHAEAGADEEEKRQIDDQVADGVQAVAVRQGIIEMPEQPVERADQPDAQPQQRAASRLPAPRAGERADHQAGQRHGYGQQREQTLHLADGNDLMQVVHSYRSNGGPSSSLSSSKSGSSSGSPR